MDAAITFSQHPMRAMTGVTSVVAFGARFNPILTADERLAS